MRRRQQKPRDTRYINCEEIKETKKDLDKSMRSLTEESIDINKIMLTNTLP